MLKSSKSKQIKPRRALVEALEPRLLFSASADVSLFEDADNDINLLEQAAASTDLSQIYSEDPPLALSQNDTSPLDDVTDPTLALIADTAEAAPDEVIFIDSKIDNYQLLIDDILQQNPDKNFKIVVLKPGENGIEQITDTLSQLNGISAVHVISHGNNGAIQLGNSELSNDTINGYSDVIQSWSNALTDSADILIYGCNLTSDEGGLALIEELANLSQADIAASDDLTGNAYLAGDWNLETRVGEIETEELIGASGT